MAKLTEEMKDFISSNLAWVATIGKELFHLSDTYAMDIADPGDALHVLMFALAMDAEKCSREEK